MVVLPGAIYFYEIEQDSKFLSILSPNNSCLLNIFKSVFTFFFGKISIYSNEIP